ncbi:hypothetical protein ACH4Q7_22815 [Streptomyces roseolus]|uniref:hypothetical protein n=1 Tax=Streptomyces roseolus TaxID=67358 RepID=UPI0037892346
MGCACKNKGRKQYQVIAPSGRVVFTSSSEPTAKAVSKRYPDSKVVEAGKETPVVK